MSLVRKVFASPGYDCIRFECMYGEPKCRPGGGGSHGRSGLLIVFLVSGEKGAVQFVIMTGWGPEPAGAYPAGEPYPSDLGYHAREPQYEGQGKMEDCEHVPEGECYYDGSTLNAEEPFRLLCNGGTGALWPYLEAYYRHVFDGGEFPQKGPSYPHAERATWDYKRERERSYRISLRWSR